MTVDPVGVSIALGAAVLFSFEAISAKRGIEAGGSPLLASLTVAVTSVVVYWAITLATTDPALFGQRSAFGIAVFLFSGLVGSGIGVLVIYVGVERVGASVATAAVNSRPLFAFALGYVLLAEVLSALSFVGMVVLVVGVVVISLSKGGDIRGWDPWEIGFPLAAAAAFAIANVARRFGLTRTDVPLVEAIAINAVGGLAVLVAYVLLRRREEVIYAPRPAYGWFGVTGLSATIGVLGMFLALERERVAVVDSILATTPLLTLVLAVVLLRRIERITLGVVVGATLVVGGATLLVVG